MKIQVMFGSSSDERVYAPLTKSLQKCGEAKMDVASAHRDPDKVHDIVKNGGADVFVAGAGLAAHLPGVVASLTAKPVFGIAVNGAFAGLDSFLSIVQMPKGVPVMAVTEENANSVSDLLKRWENLPSDKICLNWNREQESSAPVSAVLAKIKEMSGVPVEWVSVDHPMGLGQIITPSESPNMLGLNILVCEKSELQHTSLALDFFSKAKMIGAWVGANNVENLVLQWKKLVQLKGK